MSLLNVIRSSYDKEDQVLSSLGLRPNKMYLRTVVTVEGDENLGIKGTEVITDKEITPTPKVKNVSLSLVSKSDGYVEAGDRLAYISANIPQTTITAANFIKYESVLWKVIRIDATPDISEPYQWVVLIRRHANA